MQFNMLLHLSWFCNSTKSAHLTLAFDFEVHIRTFSIAVVRREERYSAPVYAPVAHTV